MNDELIRALKDRVFRRSNALAQPHPAGMTEVDDTLLAHVAGGNSSMCSASDAVCGGGGGGSGSTATMYCREL